MPTNDVQLINVTKEFAGRRGDANVLAVDHISLDIHKGEFFALLGPSGCGKTTTLRMIAGFEALTSGQILVNEKPMHKVPPFHRPVNTVFQDYALFPHLSALKNVLFGLEMEGVPRREAERRARQALEMVRLPEAARRKPGELSGGQQQRVALARALVKNPTVLLLDEPLGALDLKLRKAMQYELKDMQTRLGITFIYVTHDQEEALTMADRIAVMNTGKVLQVGTPEEIYERPHTRFVADFIGETNFLDGTLVSKNGTYADVQLPSGATVSAVLDDPAKAINSAVTLAIRPEKLRLRSESEAPSPDAPPQNAETVLLPGTISESIYIGTDTRHVVALDDKTEVVVRTQNFSAADARAFATGQTVALQWQRDNARILRD